MPILPQIWDPLARLPKMTLEEANKLFDELSSWGGVKLVNGGVTVVVNDGAKVVNGGAKKVDSDVAVVVERDRSAAAFGRCLFAIRLRAMAAGLVKDGPNGETLDRHTGKGTKKRYLRSCVTSGAALSAHLFLCQKACSVCSMKSAYGPVKFWGQNA